MKIPIAEKRKIIDGMLERPDGVKRIILHAQIAYNKDKVKGMKSIKQCLRHVPAVLKTVLAELK
jgi:hypothetical protein